MIDLGEKVGGILAENKEYYGETCADLEGRRDDPGRT
jgi:hypothetical protein